MRKRLSGFLFLVLTIYVYPKELVINQPAIEFNTSGIMNVSRVELKKNETVVYIHSSIIAHENINAFIEDCQTGKKWKVTKIDREEFSKEIYTADSDDNIRILRFPKLNDKVNKINYGEGEKIIIYGISLNGELQTSEDKKEIPVEIFDWIDKELEKAPIKTLFNFCSNNASCKEAARLIGYINGYDRRAGFSTGKVFEVNKFLNYKSSVTIQIHEDGRFEGTIPAVQPSQKHIVFKDMPFNFYIEPGHTLALILDWEDFLKADLYKDGDYHFQNIRFSGPLAQINQELLDIYYQLKEPDYHRIYKQSVTSDKSSFLSYMDSISKEYKEEIKRVIDTNTLHPTTKAILTTNQQRVSEWISEKVITYK